ncbi:MAG: hypothetical protein LKI92_11520 [Schleiferilactobacillus harbinensis]|jgi:hypothetical protein|nr:hypothetical protein [Schleiferilactobacillus harbinensis]MCI1913681.1 hypothetical protein [Schleiferilactobacillus harbinensis]
MNKREKGTSYESYIIKLPQEYFLTKSGSGPYLIHRIGPSDRIEYKSIITYDSNDQLLENVEKVGYDHRFIIIKGKKMVSDTFTSHKPYGDGYGIINVQTGRGQWFKSLVTLHEMYPASRPIQLREMDTYTWHNKFD